MTAVRPHKEASQMAYKWPIETDLAGPEFEAFRRQAEAEGITPDALMEKSLQQGLSRAKVRVKTATVIKFPVKKP